MNFTGNGWKIYMAGKRSNYAATGIRKEKIAELLVIGLSRAELLQYIAKKCPDWGVSDRQIDYYIAGAKKLLEKASKVNMERELGLGLKRLDELFKRSMAIQDYKACLAVEKHRHELLGLLKQKLEIDGDLKLEITLVDGTHDTKTSVED